MATFLGPDDPAVRSVLDEGRGMLEELGARLLLDRLDDLEAEAGGTGGRSRAAVPMASGATRETNV